VLLTDVDGLYERDPRRDPQAARIDVVENVSEVEHLAGGSSDSRGTGGMVTKLRAAQIATQAGIETLIIGGGGAGLEALARGEVRGTRFLARPHAPARKAWLAQQPARGTLHVDEGALAALRRGSSLLPSGISAVTGSFSFGDAVDVSCTDRVVARGLTNYGSDALRLIRGRRSSEIAALLGSRDYDEVIHRDNLIVL
jgi:glutamate 5-kinase